MASPDKWKVVLLVGWSSFLNGFDKDLIRQVNVTVISHFRFYIYIHIYTYTHTHSGTREIETQMQWKSIQLL